MVRRDAAADPPRVAGLTRPRYELDLCDHALREVASKRDGPRGALNLEGPYAGPDFKILNQHV